MVRDSDTDSVTSGNIEASDGPGRSKPSLGCGGAETEQATGSELRITDGPSLVDVRWVGKRLAFFGALTNITLPSPKEHSVDEHRVTGAAKNMGGKVEEGFGRATGDTKSQIQGVMDRAQGAAEKFYGQSKDAASDAADEVRKTASSFEDMVRHTIENRPYTAVAIALGIGWLFGRTHRPL